MLKRARMAFIISSSLVCGASLAHAQSRTSPCEVARSGSPIKWSSGWDEVVDGVDLITCKTGGAWISWEYSFRNRLTRNIKVYYSKKNSRGERVVLSMYVSAGSIASDSNLGGDLDPEIELIRIEYR